MTKHRLHTLVSLAAVTMIFSAAAAGSEPPATPALNSPGCLPAQGIGLELTAELTDVMGRSDLLSNDILSWMGVVRVAANQVAAVSDTTTCRRASKAYSAALASPGPDRKVHAIRVGIRYVVIDPTFRLGSYTAGVTMDSSFTQVYEKFGY